MAGSGLKLSEWKKLERDIRAAFPPPDRSLHEIQMTPGRVKRIRKIAAGDSLSDFEERFGLPARTVEGWEQGRKIDAAGRILLKIIESDPIAAERAIWHRSNGFGRQGVKAQK